MSGKTYFVHYFLFMTLCYIAGALDLFSGNVARPSDRVEMEAK